MNTPALSSLRKYTAACTALFGLLLASPAFAQALYWNTSGTAGTWATASGWSTDLAGTSASSSTPTSATDAVFNSTPVTGSVTVTLSGANDVNSLNFNTGSATTLTGGTINLYGAADSFNTTAYGINAATSATISSAIALQANQTWNVSSGTLTAGGVISGSGYSITKSGAGTLVLSNANTFNGGVTLDSGGTLVLNNAKAAGNGTITINGGTLEGQTGGGFIGAIANSMIWNGNLSLAQGGKPFVLGGGILLGSNNITISTNSNNPSKDIVISGAISDGGNNYGLTVQNLIVFSGQNTYTGTTTINSGATLIIGGTTGGGNLAAGTTGALSASGTIVNNGTLAFNRTNAVTQGADFSSSAISGSGNIVQSGSGTVTFNVINTYTGKTTINNGTTIAMGAVNAIAHTSQLVMSGGTFNAAGFSQTMSATTLSLTANSTIDLGSGSTNTALTFADSHSVGWTGGSVTLSFIDVGAGDTIQIGSSATGLTSQQLSQITINGSAALIDSNGFLTSSAIPEPAAYGLLGGLAALAVVIGYRRKMRAVGTV